MKDENPYLNQKFDFNEIVIIRSRRSRLSQYNGQRAYITDKLHPNDYCQGDSKKITYGVAIEGVKRRWSVDEDDLESTGEFLTDEIMETWILAEGQYRFRDK